MSTMNELGHAIKVRRTDIGLTQQALATLSGLSRATINQVETSHAENLSIKKASQLLGTLGLAIEFSSPREFKVHAKSLSPALAIAARTASVSYQSDLTEKELYEALSCGSIVSARIPHLATLVDEAPLTVIAAAVEQVHAESGIARAKIWLNLKTLARQFKSPRLIWS